ncbi:NAD(P)-dependent oxidoreductase [Pseudonocardia sp. SID8383]|uniref:NAD(P)-dependent oxidoreductase n=1 Tax=Pseudonocardia sp. SID8383 TaxID=2690363 RepID=UPI0013713008
MLVSDEDADRDGAVMLAAVHGVTVLRYSPDRPESAPDGEVLVAPYHRARRAISVLRRHPEIRHVQLLSSGHDRWSPHLPPGVSVGTATGAHAGPVSEWVLSAILLLLRRWPELLRHQAAEHWAHDTAAADTLSGKRALVIGAGAIGTATAAKLAAFDAGVTLVGRTARPGVRAVADVGELLAEHEVVVIAAPLTEDTRGLVDAEFLAGLPDGAIVVNAARGAIVDTAALVTEVQSGRLRAVVDVTDPEPLPAGHPAWHALTVSPHVARAVPGVTAACYRAAADTIAHLQANCISESACRAQAPGQVR